MPEFTTETIAPPQDVRSRRDRLGVTRSRLAVEADCSLTYLQTIEQGVTPRLSAVLPRVLSALDRLEAKAETGNAAQGGRGAAITDGKGRPHHAG